MIRSLKAQDSSNICLTIPQFKYYANALVERNYLRQDTADCRVKENAYLQAITEKNKHLHLDTLAFIQKDQAIQTQQTAYSNLAADFRKVERSRNGWRGFGLGTGAALVITGVVVVLTNR